VVPLKNTFTNISPSKVEIVVARYNEKLDWLHDAPFNEYPVIVYNKGPNEDFTKSPNIKKIVTLPNVGRESHTYLYHIIHNYNSLAEITCFFPGSTDIEFKLIKAKTVLDEIQNKHKETVLTCKKYDNVAQELYSFEVDEYHTTYKDNTSINQESKTQRSNIKPFGKWYKHYFGDIVTTCFTTRMVFSVSKKNILKKPKKYYENLIKEVDSHSNPETGHYFERSIEAIFYPLDPESLVEI